MKFPLLSFLAFAAGSFSALQAQVFTTPLRIPDTLSGLNVSLDVTPDVYQFFPGGDTIHTLSYNSSGFLGPTIIWYRGKTVTMHVTNYTAETVTNHWHGAHVPTFADGGPHDTIPSGATWSPTFTIRDAAATMWYHPHLHHMTMEQVQMGLAGMIIVRDESDPLYSRLPRTYGVDEFPLIFQDRQFVYDSISGDTVIVTDCAQGNTMLVNGVPNPVLHVPAQYVRFHLLNGSAERVYYLGLDSTFFQLVATDAGHTAKPYQMDSMMLSPGERAQWAVNFSGMEGDTLYLLNYSRSLDSTIAGGWQGGPFCYRSVWQTVQVDSSANPLMMIVVDSATANPVTSIPSPLTTLQIPDTNSVDRYRTKIFYPYNPDTSAFQFSIDSINFDMMVLNDTMQLNDVEVWEIRNQTLLAHPFHIHDIHFFVLSVDGDTNLPFPLRGPKDVVSINAGSTVRFVTRFTDFYTAIDPDSAYMYHCHILSHEDKGMMHQFVVVDTLGVGIGPVKGFMWSLSPNPSTGFFRLTGECMEPSTVRVIGQQGQLLRELAIPPLQGSYEFELEGLPAGVYLLQWARPDGFGHRKMLLLRNGG